VLHHGNSLLSRISIEDQQQSLFKKIRCIIRQTILLREAMGKVQKGYLEKKMISKQRTKTAK